MKLFRQTRMMVFQHYNLFSNTCHIHDLTWLIASTSTVQYKLWRSFPEFESQLKKSRNFRYDVSSGFSILLKTFSFKKKDFHCIKPSPSETIRCDCRGSGSGMVSHKMLSIESV